MGIQKRTPYTDQEFNELQHKLTHIEFKGLPRGMKTGAHPFFLFWRPTLNGDRTRILKKPMGGRAWQAPKNLRSYEQVLTDFTNQPIETAIGIGFAYNEQHPFVCIDVDKMTISNKRLVQELQSYTEQSPSGEGQHVIVRVTDKARLQQIFGSVKHNTPRHRDLYVSSGYVTMTGQTALDHSVREFNSTELHAILGSYYLSEAVEQLDGGFPEPDVPEPDVPEPDVPEPDVPEPDVPDTPKLEPEKKKKQKKAEPKKANSADYVSEASVLTAAQVQKYLDAIPVRCLTEDTFERLQQDQPVNIDLECTHEARTPWLIVGQAIHNNFSSPMASLLEGFTLWDRWSALGNKYDRKDLNDCWRSFSNSNTANPVTIKALIKLFNAQKVVYPSVGARGALLGTLANFIAYMDFYNFTARFNEISKELTLTIPEERKEIWKLLQIDTNTVDVKAEMILSDFIESGFPPTAFTKSRICSFIQAFGREKPYNPVRDYFAECGAEWDGEDRISALFNTLDLTYRDQLAEYQVKTIYMFLRRWLLQVVAAACRDSTKFDNSFKQFSRVLIFVGGQGIGKTRWVQSLFPEKLHKYCMGSKALKLTGFRNDLVKTVMEITNTLICNLNEIERQFDDRNYGDFKEFLDTDVDVIVLPYGKEPTKQIRRTVFIGSTNIPRFLTDPTGNRRVELIHCNRLNVEHGIDIDQLWGQVYDMYKSGERWWFDDKDPADTKFIAERTRLNTAAMKVHSSSFVEYLNELYDSTQPHDTWRKMTFVQIRTQVVQYMTQDRNSGHNNRFSTQKADLVNWLHMFRSPISETAGKAGSRVMYYVPPIREEIAGADFMGVPGSKS